MAYWEYIDDETKEQLTLCDFADLHISAAEQARSNLSNAYGEDNAPDFDNIGTLELSSWCDAFGVLFSPEDGSLHWMDSAETVTQRHYIHPDFKEELFTFADLPDDEARRAATVWLWEEECFAEVWDSVDPDDIPLDVARDVSNFYERLWDCSGIFGLARQECFERTDITYMVEFDELPRDIQSVARDTMMRECIIGADQKSWKSVTRAARNKNLRFSIDGLYCTSL